MTYISETLYPLKTAIKPKKQTWFAGDPVTSVNTIPVRRTGPHPPKWTIMDLDLLIPIELSQARAENDLNQDLGGNLSVMSPRGSHHTEETLPKVPLGQFQDQRSDNTTTNSIAHFNIHTLSQSEINSTITENIVPPETNTPFQREIFSETGTGTSSSKDVSDNDGDIPEEASHQTGTESKHEEASDNSCNSKTTTSSQSEIFLSYNNNSDCETYTSSQSEITTDYDANSESSNRETSKSSSQESGNLTTRMLYSPFPEMAIVHRIMHDAIHAVRDQQGRAVTRSLLSQQRTLAANKLQCNIQIKRTSTPDPPSMSNAPPRLARARSEKANGVTSGSSEESDCEPQTARKAQFEALKRQFEIPTKSEEESSLHGPVKRQRLFCTSSSQRATDFPSTGNCTPGPSQRSNGPASEGD